MDIVDYEGTNRSYVIIDGNLISWPTKLPRQEWLKKYWDKKIKEDFRIDTIKNYPKRSIFGGDV